MKKELTNSESVEACSIFDVSSMVGDPGLDVVVWRKEFNQITHLARVRNN